MTSKISFACPSCRARINAPVELIGQKRKCPGCDFPFVVRSHPPKSAPTSNAPPPDAGPILIADTDTVDMLFDDEVFRPSTEAERVQRLEAENARLKQMLAQRGKAG